MKERRCTACSSQAVRPGRMRRKTERSTQKHQKKILDYSEDRQGGQFQPVRVLCYHAMTLRASSKQQVSGIRTCNTHLLPRRVDPLLTERRKQPLQHLGLAFCPGRRKHFFSAGLTIHRLVPKKNFPSSVYGTFSVEWAKYFAQNSSRPALPEVQRRAWLLCGVPSR